MFSKNDYFNYFDQLAHIERRMIYRAYELDLELDDEPLKRILKKIGDDEVRHYGYVQEMAQFVAGPGVAENRRGKRDPHLALVRLQGRGDDASRELGGYCVNLSKTGIGIETESVLEPGKVFDLELSPLDKEKIRRRTGKVVWSKEVHKGFFISGLQFMDPGADQKKDENVR